MNNLGELFRQIRSRKNWSVSEAAKKMGISNSYLRILEKGIDPRTGRESTPKPDTLRILSKAYDYPYEELMKAAGYLSDEKIPNREFDLTVFICNMNLIMGDMSMEQLSKDIFDKTGYNINANQIRSYMNGDIQPFPGTINILSKYARVTTGFWYVFNTEETLEQDRKKYEETVLKASTDKFGRDFAMFTSLSDEIKDWVVAEDNLPYLKIAMEAKEKNIEIGTIKSFVSKHSLSE